MCKNTEIKIIKKWKKCKKENKEYEDITIREERQADEVYFLKTPKQCNSLWQLAEISDKKNQFDHTNGSFGLSVREAHTLLHRLLNFHGVKY